MSSIYSIYKATNTTNGKVYIGFDSNWPNRKYGHISNSDGNSSTKFHRAIRKYGINNFNWEIVYQSKNGNHCKDVMENYFIQEYDSFKNGYNMTLGGDGTLGHKKTKKSKQKMKNNWKNKNHFFNSQQFKDAVSQSTKKAMARPEVKEKQAYNRSFDWKITNKEGQIFFIRNLTQFCKDNNLSQGNMTEVSKGKRTHHKGWTCHKLVPHIHPVFSH